MTTLVSACAYWWSLEDAEDVHSANQVVTHQTVTVTMTRIQTVAMAVQKIQTHQILMIQTRQIQIQMVVASLTMATTGMEATDIIEESIGMETATRIMAIDLRGLVVLIHLEEGRQSLPGRVHEGRESTNVHVAAFKGIVTTKHSQMASCNIQCIRTENINTKTSCYHYLTCILLYFLSFDKPYFI